MLYMLAKLADAETVETREKSEGAGVPGKSYLLGHTFIWC